MAYRKVVTNRNMPSVIKTFLTHARKLPPTGTCSWPHSEQKYKTSRSINSVAGFSLIVLGSIGL